MASMPVPSRAATAAATRKPAGVDAGHHVGAGYHVGERVGNRRHRRGVGEQRGEVLELDARLREIGDLAGQRRDRRPQAVTVTASTPIGPCSSPRPIGSDSCSPRTFSSTSAACAADGTAAASASRSRAGRGSPSSRAPAGSAGHRQRADDAVDLGVGVAGQVVAVAAVQVVRIDCRRAAGAAACRPAGAGHQDVDLVGPQRLWTAVLALRTTRSR